MQHSTPKEEHLSLSFLNDSMVSSIDALSLYQFPTLRNRVLFWFVLGSWHAYEITTVRCSLFLQRSNQFSFNNSLDGTHLQAVLSSIPTRFVIKLYLISSLVLIMHSWKVLISFLKALKFDTLFKSISARYLLLLLFVFSMLRFIKSSTWDLRIQRSVVMVSATLFFNYIKKIQAVILENTQSYKVRVYFPTSTLTNLFTLFLFFKLRKKSRPPVIWHRNKNWISFYI